MKDFLKHYILPQKGKVLDEDGKIIGEHDGAYLFTLGERHGFKVHKKTPRDEPYYVIGKNIAENTIMVSAEKVSQGLRVKSYNLKQINWIGEMPKESQKIKAQTRYHGELHPCHVKHSVFNMAEVKFEGPVLVSSGQSIVFYGGEVCLGGGIIN